MISYIISSHMNPTLSGVAKFSHILGEKLNIPCIGFAEAFHQIQKNDHVLLSLKLVDAINDQDSHHVNQFVQRIKSEKIKFDLFFHTFDGLNIEYDLLDLCNQVYCANEEIKHTLCGFDKPLVDVWCPRLVDLSSKIKETEFNIFSFGMAHKIQSKYHKILYDRIESYGVDYSLWISTAFHEKASFGDFNSISTQLIGIYGKKIQFLGFLSDEAISYFLERTQLFVAFFPKGVRSNNTSIYVAMEKGIPILTNLDEYSPSWIKHGVHLLDINQLDSIEFLPERFHEISQNAQLGVRTNASWESLISKFQ
ncbi:MAG: hypothetical protein HQM12_17630 [SAR324 cluster bacterium]|nr:hypothetical protein [SAR324 cluster bacterium]